MKYLIIALLMSTNVVAGERAYFRSELVPAGTNKIEIRQYNEEYHREMANQREMEELRYTYELEKEREMHRQEEFEYVETWKSSDCDEYIIRNKHSNYYNRDCR